MLQNTDVESIPEALDGLFPGTYPEITRVRPLGEISSVLPTGFEPV
jgi:hypothetical protein